MVVAAWLMPTCMMQAQGAPNSSPQTVQAASGPRLRTKHRDVPKVELFLGYSYLRGVPTLSPGNRMVDLNGGSASITFNVTHYLGLVGEFGGYNDTQLRLTGPGANPPRIADSGGSAYTYLFGPRLSYRKYDRITPFAQALFGGAYASSVTLSTCTGSTCTPLPQQNAFALVAGGGLDIRLFRHVSLRAVQAEYMMTRFNDPTTNASQQQNDLRLATGLVFRFGGNTPVLASINHPPTAICSASGSTVSAGSGLDVAIRGQASDPDSDPLTYSWTATGGSVEGSGPEASWNSSGVAAGSYTVSLRVDDGRGGVADCSTDVHVEAAPNRRPMINCSVDHTSVNAGELVLVTAVASDPDGDPLTFSWSASGGKIIGSGASVHLDTAGLSSGQYAVTGSVSDDRGGTADCTADVDARAPTELELRLALHSIYFPTAQPSSQNTEGGLLASQNQTLTALAADFEAYLQTKPDASLALEGHADPRGSVEYNQALSERRVDSMKRFLVAHGIPAEKIQTKAFGVQDNLTDDQVRSAVENNPELSASQLKQVLDHMATIILASNRRVDVTLSSTGQQSLRQYPFNAADSLSLLSQGETHELTRATKEKNPNHPPTE
jgi:outer membrane protein OmpA-like peptidoglycan-associated protein